MLKIKVKPFILTCLFVITITLLVIVLITNDSYYYDVYLNNEKIVLNNYIKVKKDVQLVPLKEICEYFDIRVDFNEENKNIHVQYEGNDLLLTLNENYGVLNGNRVDLQYKVNKSFYSKDIYVPADLFINAFEFTIDTNEKDKIIKISDNYKLIEISNNNIINKLEEANKKFQVRKLIGEISRSDYILLMNEKPNKRLDISHDFLEQKYKYDGKNYELRITDVCYGERFDGIYRDNSTQRYYDNKFYANHGSEWYFLSKGSEANIGKPIYKINYFNGKYVLELMLKNKELLNNAICKINDNGDLKIEIMIFDKDKSDKLLERYYNYLLKNETVMHAKLTVVIDKENKLKRDYLFYRDCFDIERDRSKNFKQSLYFNVYRKTDINYDNCEVEEVTNYIDYSDEFGEIITDESLKYDLND